MTDMHQKNMLFFGAGLLSLRGGVQTPPRVHNEALVAYACKFGFIRPGRTQKQSVLRLVADTEPGQAFQTLHGVPQLRHYLEPRAGHSTSTIQRSRKCKKGEVGE